MLGNFHRRLVLICFKYSLFYCVLQKVIIADPAFRNKDIAVAFSRANKEFMLSLLKQFPSESNVFYSPFSVSTVLAMIRLGASSETLKEMNKALHFDEMDQDVFSAFETYLEFLSKDIGNNTLKIANKIFLNRKFSAKESFLKNCIKHFNATIETMDFFKSDTSTKTIDSWVSQQTENNIHLHVTLDMAMILVNAIYFKGNWNKKFKTRQTRKIKFWNGTANLMTEMMYQKDYFKFCHVSDLDFDILELPFEGKLYSMLILLPTVMHNLEAMKNDLTEEVLQNAISKLRKQKVEVYLPKFKIESDFWLKSILSSLNMTLAFQTFKADFSLMSRSGTTFMGEGLHRTFFNLDEEGAEAASLTGITVKNTASVQITQKFQADHPFLFFIRDTVNDVMPFAGRFYTPFSVQDQPEIENAAQKNSMSVITIAYIITVPGIIIICIGVNVVTYKCGVKKGRRIERKHKLQEFQEETQTVHYQHYQTDTENPEAIPLAQQGPSAGQRSVDPSHDYAAYDEIKDQRQRMQESQKRKEGGYLTPVSQGQSRALPPVRTNGDGYVSPKTTAKKSQEEVGKTSKGESPSPPGDGGYISPLQHEKDASERVGSGNSDSSSEKSDKSDKSRKYQNDPQSKASPKTKALYESLKDTGVTQEHDYIELQT